MTEADQILFQQYLDNALSPSDRHVFEERLKSDKELQREFELYRDMQIYLQDRANSGDALKILHDVHSEYKLKNEKQPKRWRWLIALPAAMLVFTLVYFFFFKEKKEKEPLQFADFYVEPVWEVSRGESDLGEIFSLYKQGRIGAAVDSLHRFSRISESERAYWLAELYLADQKADSTLKYIQQSGLIRQKRDRVLYLTAMSYLLKGDQESLQNLIDSLPLDVDPYYLERIEVLL